VTGTQELVTEFWFGKRSESGHLHDLEGDGKVRL